MGGGGGEWPHGLTSLGREWSQELALRSDLTPIPSPVNHTQAARIWIFAGTDLVAPEKENIPLP